MDMWLQLGLGGAALFILYKFIDRLFAYLETRNKLEDKASNKTGDNVITSINRLCNNMDKLVDAFHSNTEKVNDLITCNSKDNQIIKDTTDMQFSLLKEINSKVDRIDVKTDIIFDKKEGD